MKVYATVSSERAAKGQGGNKQLDTLYTIGEGRTPFMRVQMTVKEDETVLVQVCDAEIGRIVYERLYRLEDYKQKGKKQTGKECLHSNCTDDGDCHACGVNVFQ